MGIYRPGKLVTSYIMYSTWPKHRLKQQQIECTGANKKYQVWSLVKIVVRSLKNYLYIISSSKKSSSWSEQIKPSVTLVRVGRTSDSGFPPSVVYKVATA
jgi:hypothetical protein